MTISSTQGASQAITGTQDASQAIPVSNIDINPVGCPKPSTELLDRADKLNKDFEKVINRLKQEQELLIHNNFAKKILDLFIETAGLRGESKKDAEGLDTMYNILNKAQKNLDPITGWIAQQCVVLCREKHVLEEFASTIDENLKSGKQENDDLIIHFRNVLEDQLIEKIALIVNANSVHSVLLSEAKSEIKTLKDAASFIKYETSEGEKINLEMQDLLGELEVLSCALDTPLEEAPFETTEGQQALTMEMQKV